MIDFRAKQQVNICTRLEKKSGKLFDRWSVLSPRPVISPKIDGGYQNSNLICKSWWLIYMPKIRSIPASIQENSLENCLIAEIYMPKIRSIPASIQENSLENCLIAEIY